MKMMIFMKFPEYQVIQIITIVSKLKSYDFKKRQGNLLSKSNFFKYFNPKRI
jgi:hypothetical protein